MTQPTISKDKLSKLVAIAQLRQLLVRAGMCSHVMSDTEPDRAQYAKLRTIYTLAATASKLLNDYADQAMRE